MTERPQGTDRLVEVEETRHRLQVFRYVFPLRKDQADVALQMALRVQDQAARRDLLMRLHLEDAHSAQRPPDGPFKGSAVFEQLVSSSMAPDAGTLDVWLVRVRLWNETGRHADLDEVTQSLVEQAELVEHRLVALGLDQHPMEIDLLGFDRG